ncbi:phosphate/phosphite/phosphonate ABC transporter substrate-binding protein [Pseudodesulfovibrio tunisiensis]|uniref:phosphate/phosphite/phosphonate ABC transporter substrate-binding protein n=1 Tax=Pseudodesulfovibrio tunisiensis TaxID=463192 RepID=UPI001FB212E4|nr:phosphate/phosphite/phosphonate ABC transporter substrate-binding protein [Pseudodesulfovibrio tunisiensis]
MRRLFAILLLVLSVSAPAAAGTVKFGMFPSNDPVKLQKVMDMLAQYLEKNTGDRVEAVITRDYHELADRLENRTLDMAWTNTLNYVRLKKAVPTIQYITTYRERNEDSGTIQPFYQSYLVTLESSDIHDLIQARGKRFAFTDLDSTSGYAYPNMMLRKQGIDPSTYFGKVFFLKKHDRVVEALLAGAIDLGAMSDGTYFTATRKHGEKFRILDKSDPIPLDAIIANEEVSSKKVLAYRRALESMPPDHAFCKAMKSILGWSAAGFQARDDAFYDSVRESLRN